jgi:protein-arginine kinase activator protein McsA
MIFGRRKNNFNDLFNEFDSMFSQFDSMFGGLPNKSEIEKGTDELGNWTKETFMSEDGSVHITSFIRTGGEVKTNDNSVINDLKQKLKLAVESEKFEDAVKLRDQIKKYESNQKEITKLELELKKSIDSQDFEKSIELRDKLKKLKS